MILLNNLVWHQFCVIEKRSYLLLRTDEWRLNMNAFKLAVGTLGMLVANAVLAGQPPPIQTLPMEEGGLFAVAAVLLVAGIKIVRQKRNR